MNAGSLPEPLAPSESGAARLDESYARELPGLTRFVMRLGADPHTAADVANSAFAASLPCWEGLRNPPAWLRTVASRIYYRQRLCPETPVETVPDRPLFREDPAELSEQTNAVYALLATLPERPRQVMAWYLDGYRVAEIAERIGISPDAVRQNLHRARERLKQLLPQPPAGAGEGGRTR